MNDGIIAYLGPTLAYYNNHFAHWQSRVFPTKLCCNTIIHLLFHYFLSLGSLLHFKFLNILVCLVFCYSIKLYTCDFSIRATAVLEYLESARGFATIFSLC